MAPVILIVAHGKSEYILLKNISRGSKANVLFYSRNRGEETIAISHLHDLFTTGDLSTDAGIVKATGAGQAASRRAPI